jgi:hypothetical protein
MTSAATTGATGQTGTTAPKDPMVGLETGRESALSNYARPLRHRDARSRAKHLPQSRISRTPAP